MEIWKVVDGWDLYDVSDHGNVRSWNGWRGRRAEVPRLLRPRWDSRGYARVQLCANGPQSERFIHQLVLEHFVGPRPSAQHEGRHFPDRDPSNNRAANLSWATHAENMLDQHAHGTRARGTSHGMVKLSEEQIREIRGARDSGKALAARFGVAPATICRIRQGRAWAHLP